MALSRKRKLVYLTVGILLLISLFISLGLAYQNPIWTDLNKIIGAILYNFLGDGWVPVFTVITNIGSGVFSFPITGILVMYLLFRKHYWIAVLVAYNLIGVRQFNHLLKSIFEVARPELEHLVHASYYSFPSGHSMNSIAFFGLLAFLLSKHWARTKTQSIWIWTSVSILILLIGLSRVYLGVHYPMDVLGGFAAGGAWLLLSICIYSFLPVKDRDTLEKRYMRG